MCGQGRPAAADEAGSTGLDRARHAHDGEPGDALGCVVRSVRARDPAQAQRMSVRRVRNNRTTFVFNGVYSTVGLYSSRRLL